MSSALDAILGKPAEEDKSVSELHADATEPEAYRPYVIRARPQMGFVLMDAAGNSHGILYHTLRHPKHRTIEGREYLSFTSDGTAVVMEGTALKIVFLAIMRHTLLEVRECDGRPSSQDIPTRVTRLEVSEPGQRGNPPARLVK